VQENSLDRLAGRDAHERIGVQQKEIGGFTWFDGAAFRWALFLAMLLKTPPPIFAEVAQSAGEGPPCKEQIDFIRWRW